MLSEAAINVLLMKLCKNATVISVLCRLADVEVRCEDDLAPEIPVMQPSLEFTAAKNVVPGESYNLLSIVGF